MQHYDNYAADEGSSGGLRVGKVERRLQFLDSMGYTNICTGHGSSWLVVIYFLCFPLALLGWILQLGLFEGLKFLPAAAANWLGLGLTNVVGLMVIIPYVAGVNSRISYYQLSVLMLGIFVNIWFDMRRSLILLIWLVFLFLIRYVDDVRVRFGLIGGFVSLMSLVLGDATLWWSSAFMGLGFSNLDQRSIKDVVDQRSEKVNNGMGFGRFEFTRFGVTRGHAPATRTTPGTGTLRGTAHALVPVTFGYVPGHLLQRFLFRSNFSSEDVDFRMWALLGDTAARTAIIIHTLQSGGTVHEASAALTRYTSREAMARRIVDTEWAARHLVEPSLGSPGKNVCAELFEVLLGLHYYYDACLGRVIGWHKPVWFCLTR